MLKWIRKLFRRRHRIAISPSLHITYSEAEMRLIENMRREHERTYIERQKRGG